MVVQSYNPAYNPAYNVKSSISFINIYYWVLATKKCSIYNILFKLFKI